VQTKIEATESSYPLSFGPRGRCHIARCPVDAFEAYSHLQPSASLSDRTTRELWCC